MTNSGSKDSHLKRSKTSLRRRKKSECIGSEATEQRKPNDQDRKQEEMYKTLVENIPCAAYSAFPGETGPTTFMSQNWKDWTGYSAEELYQDPEAWPKCIYPDDREKAVDAYIEACRNEAPYNLEYRIVHRETGQVRYVRDQGLLSKDTKGTLIRVDGIITDITELKTSENELVKYRDHLEELVKERTAELEKANEVLKLQDNERKKTEEMLRTSEEKYRSMIELFPAVIVVINKLGFIVSCNNALERISGYPKDELVGKHFTKLGAFRLKEVPKYLGLFAKALKGGVRKPLEVDFTRRDGSNGTVEVRVSLLNDGKIQAIATNITERKKAEEELRQYDHIVSSSTDMLALLDKRFVYMAANSSYLKAFGKTPDEVIGHTVSEVFGKEFFETVIKPNAECCLSGEEVNYQAWFDFPANKLRYMEINYYPYIDSNNEVSGFVVNGRDITERKKAQEALRQSEETARALLDATMDSGLLIDREGIIIDLNDNMAISLGKTREDMIGTVIYDYLPADLVEQRKAKGVEAARTRKPIHFEDQRGERWLENCAYPIVDTIGEVNRFAIYSRDITERKKAEEKLLGYQAKLKSLVSQLSLIEERERRRIAMELHDQIGQSLVFSKIKLDELHHSATSTELTKALDEICNNIGQIIQDTRTLTFDLSSPILNELGFEAAVTDWLDVQIREKHGIKTEFEDDGQPKPLDEDIQALLFRNVRELLINVVKHANAQNVKVSVSKVDDLINISVEDNGKGFDPNEVASKATFGLFSIRERLEQLDGSFELQSEPGHGSKFTITAPLKRV